MVGGQLSTDQRPVTMYCVEMPGLRTTTNEKVERERGIDYTSSAAEEKFVRNY